ncbi:uncharacterized protein KD926_009691 [Aspergillus affinis]|uniref:uncharacterized protein n=1 Tax=Aspergillus affinis TaxID=1070780 RepID=UPI0022FEE1BC|nr:uncharacterized protein KD926_009691 [Aspergillus affinis]KAI9045277.1 hypothetical protein KD926_009691 [Aspergillus affinis]
MLFLTPSNMLSIYDWINYFLLPQLLYTLSKNIYPPYHSRTANIVFQLIGWVFITTIYPHITGKLIETSRNLKNPSELDEEVTMAADHSNHVESQWDVVINVDVVEDEGFVIVPSNVVAVNDTEDEDFVIVPSEVVAVNEVDMVKEPIAIPPTSELLDATLELVEAKGVESAFTCFSIKDGYAHQQTQTDFKVVNTSASSSSAEVVNEAKESDSEWNLLNASSSIASVANGVTENDSGVKWVYGDDGKVKGVEYINIPSTLYGERMDALKAYTVSPFIPNGAQLRVLINFTIKLMDDVNRAKGINGELCDFINELLYKDHVKKEPQTDLDEASESVPPVVPPSNFHLSEATEKVFNLIGGCPIEPDYEVVEPGSVPQQTNLEEVAETGDTDSTTVDADAEWEIPSVKKMDDQEDGADEVDNTLTVTAANEDDRFEFVPAMNAVAIDLFSPAAFDWALDKEEEQENEERLKELLRPSAFDWADEADGDDEESVVARDENGFPRGMLYNSFPEGENWAMDQGLMSTDMNGFPEMQATPPSGLASTDGGEDETARNFPEQDGPIVHHYNWLGAPVFEQSDTPPEVSLLVRSVPRKRLGRSDKYRFRSIMHRAELFIDPVIVMLEEGVKRQTQFERVTELVRYATGRTFKFYSPYGAWVADPQENGSIVVDEQTEDVEMNERNILNNGRLGCKLKCSPSYGLERELRSRREHFRVRTRSQKPSPLRQIMTVDDLSPENGETVTRNPLAILTDEESQQGDSSTDQSVFSSATDSSQSDSDSDWEDIEMSDELRNIDLGGKPRGKVSEPQASDLNSDFELKETWTDVSRKDCLLSDPDPVESQVATLIESPKSDSLSMGWIKDFIPWCPEPYRKVDGLGHNKLGLCPNVQVTVYPVLLDSGPVPALALEKEWVKVDGDLPTSLYSREIDEIRLPWEPELSDSSDVDSLSSGTFSHNVDTYHSIVSDEFNASFDGDERMVSSGSLSLITDSVTSTLQLSSSQEDAAAVPLPPSPTLGRKIPKWRTRRSRANLRRPVALRHRVTPLRTTLPIRRSLSTMANKDKRCHCGRRISLLDEPAEPEPAPSNSGSECTFPADYDSFNRLGVKPPRRRFSPLALLEKCISKARNGARALFKMTEKEREPEEENGRKVRRKLTKRRKERRDE